jgi:putative acetyltransferase
MLARLETADDIAAIRAVNTEAFGGPLEAALVDALRHDGVIIASLVAENHGVVIGHILFSRLVIETPTATIPAAALAPMAVTPEHQRRGVGSLLVQAGLDRCRAFGEQIVLVVGHPDYYPRFGFSHALTRNLRSPYDGEAFMALELHPGALAGVRGEVRYSPPFAAVS